jgi:hypothetical protein
MIIHFVWLTGQVLDQKELSPVKHFPKMGTAQ